MCFYYSITKKSINALVKHKIVKEEQLNIFDEYKIVVNGFDHPQMPIITNEKLGVIQYFQWGFLPTEVASKEQAADFMSKYNTLNAKAENIETSKLYSDAFLNRRCLVLCSGFFEWRKVKKQKVPYYISLKNDEMFVFAGIWNNTTDKAGKVINNYAVITIEANELMATIHNEKKRMPLILSPEDAVKWLSAETTPEELKSIIKPISSDQMKAHTIKRFIPANSKNINSTEIIAYYNYPDVEDFIKPDNTLF